MDREKLEAVVRKQLCIYFPKEVTTERVEKIYAAILSWMEKEQIGGKERWVACNKCSHGTQEVIEGWTITYRRCPSCKGTGVCWKDKTDGDLNAKEGVTDASNSGH